MQQPLADKPADAAGIDLSLIRESLRRTPTERIEHMLRALRFAQDLRDAHERARRPPAR